MDNALSKAGIPSLRGLAGGWVHDGQGKVELFAKALSSKFVLPDEVEGDPVLKETQWTMMSDCVLLPEIFVLRELSRVRGDLATGLDGLPARILRHCARSLYRSVTALIRKML